MSYRLGVQLILIFVIFHNFLYGPSSGLNLNIKFQKSIFLNIERYSVETEPEFSSTHAFYQYVYVMTWIVCPPVYTVVNVLTIYGF